MKFIDNEVNLITNHARRLRLNEAQRDEAVKKVAFQKGVVKSLIHKGIQFGQECAQGPDNIKDHARRYVLGKLWKYCKPSEFDKEFNEHYTALAKSDTRRAAFWDSLMSVIGFRDST